MYSGDGDLHQLLSVSHIMTATTNATLGNRGSPFCHSQFMAIILTIIIFSKSINTVILFLFYVSIQSSCILALWVKGLFVG